MQARFWAPTVATNGFSPMATKSAATAGFPLSGTNPLTWIGRHGREAAIRGNH